MILVVSMFKKLIHVLIKWNFCLINSKCIILSVLQKNKVHEHNIYILDFRKKMKMITDHIFMTLFARGIYVNIYYEVTFKYPFIKI